MEVRTENILNRLIYYLRTISLFGTCLHIAWSVLIVGLSLFLDYDNFVITIPAFIPIISYIAIIAIGVVIWFRLRSDNQSHAAMLVYQIFYYFIPIVISLIKIIFFDILYHYDGGMFPGLAGLGSYMYYMFIIGLCVTGCVTFHIVRVVRKKKWHKDGGHDDGAHNNLDNVSVWTRISDFLNVILCVVIIVAVLGFAISYGVEMAEKSAHQRDISRNDEYRTELLTALIESDRYEKAMWKGINEDGTIDRGDAVEGLTGSEDEADNRGGSLDSSSGVALFDEAEDELCWEAYTYASYVEAMANDPSIKADDEQSVGISTITAEVLRQGRDNYIEFTKDYTPDRGVEMLNQDILYDYGTKTVSVSSELYCIDEKNRSTAGCCMVVVFDSKWKVVEIRCQKGRLVQYVPY